jgi:hypothetical protein
MDQHWASARSVLAGVGWWPDVLARAYRNYFATALASKPTIVLLVLTNRTPADVEALKTMAAGFRAVSAHILMFDDVEDSHTTKAPPEQTALIAKNAGVEIIPAHAILDAAPNHDSFPCMDGIHKKGALLSIDGDLMVEGLTRHALALFLGYVEPSESWSPLQPA